MQVLSKSTLRAFWQKHPQARVPLETWYTSARAARWTQPAEIKRVFGTNVDFVGDSRAIFDIGGNKYRIVAHIAFEWHQVMIKFVGTHAEYDRINPETV